MAKRPTIKDLISKKDYDCIEFRMLIPKMSEMSIFWGYCKSANGELIPLDGDCYSEDDEVLEWEEWSRPEKGIMHGLSVIVEGEVLDFRKE